MNDRLDIVEGAVGIRDGRIVSIGPEPEGRWDSAVDARGAYLLPGFIQTHVHLCQTLFRGLADDMPLLDWLKRRVWPLEAAHTPGTLRASARLAATELLLSGTTTVLTMETVHDTDVVFETLAETGMRAVVGKCMMDSADDVPAQAAGEDVRPRSTRASRSRSGGMAPRPDGCVPPSRHGLPSRAPANCSRPSPRSRSSKTR